MKIGRLKPDNKWNWGISFGQSGFTMNPLAKTLRIWCFKYNEKIDIGMALPIGWMKKPNRGFFFVKDFLTKWNIILHTKSINFIYWISIKKD